MPEITAIGTDILPTSALPFAPSTAPQQPANLFASLLSQQFASTTPSALTAALPAVSEPSSEPERELLADGSGELLAGALLLSPLQVGVDPVPVPPTSTTTSSPTASASAPVDLAVSTPSLEATPSAIPTLPPVDGSTQPSDPVAGSETIASRPVVLRAGNSATSTNPVVPNTDPSRTTNQPVITAERPAAPTQPQPPTTPLSPAAYKHEEALRSADGSPSIVAQTPIVTDRSQALPSNPVAFASDPFRLPLTEPAPVSGAFPVSSDGQTAIQTTLRGGGQSAIPVDTALASESTAFQTVLDTAESQPTASPAPGWTPTLSTPSQPSGPRPADHTAPPLSSQVADAIVTHARVVDRGDSHEFQLRLDPAELGEVKVRLVSTGDRVQAEVTVSSEAVRGMIESQLPELKQRLEAAGLTVSKFDVNTQTGGGSNSHRTPNQANPWDPPTGGIFPNRPTPVSHTPPTTVLVGGTLDVTA